jgi:hypothetical protein
MSATTLSASATGSHTSTQPLLEGQQQTQVLSRTGAQEQQKSIFQNSEFLNYQTNWHYWLQQKLPEVLAESSL